MFISPVIIEFQTYQLAFSYSSGCTEQKRLFKKIFTVEENVKFNKTNKKKAFRFTRLVTYMYM